MRFSIRGKLILALGLILALQLLAGVLIDVNTRDVRRTFNHLVAFEEQASRAAGDMQVASESLSLDVMNFLAAVEPRYQHRYQANVDRFARAFAEYLRLTEDRRDKQRDGEIRDRYVQFTQLGQTLMATRATQDRCWKDIYRRFRAAAAVETLSPAGPWREAARDLERLILSDLQAPSAESEKGIHVELADLAAHLSPALQEVSDPRARSALQDLVGLNDPDSVLHQLLAAADSLSRDTSRFMSLRQDLERVLDEQVNALAGRGLADAHAATTRAVDRNREAVLLFMLVGLALGGGSAGWIGGRVVRAARGLREGARRIGAGDLQFRIPHLSHDELGEAALEFNAMAEFRQRAESALREEKSRVQAILASVPDGVFTLDEEGRLVEFNPAAEQIFGIARADVIHQRFEDLFLAESHRAMVARGLADHLRDQDGLSWGQRVEWTLQRRDGTPFPAELAFIRVADAQPACYTGYVRDLTAARQEEKRKAELRDRAARAERMAATGRLAEGVADLLNNVLGPVVGYPELLSRELPASSPLRAPLAEIERAGAEAAAVIHDLQLIGRGSNEKREAVRVEDLVAECLRSPDVVAEQRRRPHARIAFEAASNLPAIAGAPRQLNRVVTNLIQHALRSITFKGVVEVGARLERPGAGSGIKDQEAPGECVALFVRDAAPPLERHRRENIFEPFAAGDGADGESANGLALTLVDRVVRDHGGLVNVQTSPTGGNEFVLYFPLAPPAPVVPAPEPLPVLGGHETVLVVDDREELRRLAAALLGHQGYRVLTAESGEAALALARLSPDRIDLLVLDFLLGDGIDGVETFQQFAELRPDIRAILVSGFAETGRMLEGRRLGIGQFIQKPYNATTLGQAVRKELDRVAMPAQPG